MNEKDFLNQNAIRNLRIKSEYVDRAKEMIEREFGQEWLDSLVRNYKPTTIRSPSSYHPIYNGLVSGVVNPMTLTLIELATYLEYLRKAVENADVALPGVIQELKVTDRFYEYLFQLMLTVRFRLVVSPLYMEQMIQTKQPDIWFQYFGTEFIIEATRPGQPEKTKSLQDLIERCFFWLEDHKKDDKFDLRITVKMLDLNKYESDLKAALLRAIDTPNARVEHGAFDIDRYEFAGTAQDFNSIHMPLVQQGKELACAIFSSTDLPLPPNFNLEKKVNSKTLVADFTAIDDDLYQDISDKIDEAVSTKVRQLYSLRNEQRQMYVFVDISEITQTRHLDLDRVIPRLRANTFNKYPGLLTGVVLCSRVWDDNWRRNRLSIFPIFGANEVLSENLLLFRHLVNLEEFNDFVGNIRGWAESDNALCSCASGKIYAECCKTYQPC